MSMILRVAKYCVPYKFLALGTFICAVLSTLFGLVYPKVTGHVVDTVLVEKGDYTALFWGVGIVLTSFFLRDVLNSLRIHLNNFFEQNVIFDMRNELYEVMQRLPLKWFDNRATGDLMTRVTEDVMAMERVLIDGIEQGFVAILQIVGVSIFLFLTDLELAFWSMAPIPLLMLGAWLYTSTALVRYKIQRKAASAMNALLLDNLQGVRQIKSYSREKQESEHFSEKADGVREGTLTVMKAWARYSPSMEFISSLGYVLVLLIGGQKVLSGEMSKGELTTFFLYVLMYYEPFRRLHQLNQLVQAGRAAADRVFSILDTKQEKYEPQGNQTLPHLMGTGRSVSFERISFSYDDESTVLHDISLEAKAGKTIALVGPTGAGKSTLVNLITRFYEYSQGLLKIDGVDVKELSLPTLRKEIGVVTQEAFLFNDTIRYNLQIGYPEASESDIWRALTAANAQEFVREMPQGLDTLVGERGVKLSVGEKQRLSIARALLKDPPVLILDEATASVDTATEKLIQEALDRLLKDRTSFVIAHRLSTVRHADLICVLEHGKIIEKGSHETLLKEDRLYARLCRAQTLYHTIEDTLAYL
ncbi:MAG: ABC transporter ATP-binding protein [Verrucomicrobiota bacterium]